MTRMAPQEFLDLVSDDPSLSAEALRRLGDLELEATEAAQATSQAQPAPTAPQPAPLVAAPTAPPAGIGIASRVALQVGLIAIFIILMVSWKLTLLTFVVIPINAWLVGISSTGSASGREISSRSWPFP